jgi:hypothetical protein
MKCMTDKKPVGEQPRARYDEPAHETEKEQTDIQLIDIAVEVGLSYERDVIDEMRQTNDGADKTLDEIRQGIERIKDE